MQLSFSGCRLNLVTRELWREGKLVHLTPKAYGLLEALIRSRPRLLTRAELDELLWPRTFVARSSLGRLVAELRAAIGDDARNPCVIRTAHGVGYAFCAETEAGPTPPVAARFALIWGGRPFALDEGEYLLGRGSDCSIVVDAAGVSRHHARIEVAGDQVIIDDLASKNGTFLNRRRIEGRTPLRHLDEISVGAAVLTMRRLTDSTPTLTLYDA
ncbi:MAG: FHA domain-containing protein [Pseudomonadota bacterium]|nr:FHA domain-containing protein [Pseudomonadota bacterium]